MADFVFWCVNIIRDSINFDSGDKKLYTKT